MWLTRGMDILCEFCSHPATFIIEADGTHACYRCAMFDADYSKLTFV